MALTKDKGKKLKFAQLGGEASISPKFISAMGRNEEIQPVPDDVAPEALATTIVESKVETNRTNERVRRTVKKTTGTITLTEKVRTEHGIATRTETLATAGVTTPSSSALVLKADTDNKGNGQEETDSIEVASFPQLSGQLYDRQNDLVIQYTEQRKVTGSNQGDAGTEITPEDFSRSMVRVYNITAIKAAYAAFHLGVPDYVNFTDGDIPPVLTVLTANYTADSGSGVHDETGAASSTGATISVSLSLTGSSEGSASVSPFVAPQILEVPKRPFAVMQYFGYMDGGFTQAQLLTKLAGVNFANATVNAWPAFKPVAITILAKTRKVSGRAEAAASTSYGKGTDRVDAATSSGQSKSVQVSTGIQVIQIPPTLHANLAGSIPADATTNFSAVARVNLTGSGGPASKDSGTATTGTLTAGGGFSSTSLAATTITTWPTTGLYLFNVQTSQAEFGQVLFRAIVFDFSTL